MQLAVYIHICAHWWPLASAKIAKGAEMYDCVCVCMCVCVYRLASEEEHDEVQMEAEEASWPDADQPMADAGVGLDRHMGGRI